MKNYLILLLLTLPLFCNAQNEIKYLTKTQIEEDIKYIDTFLQKKYSYQGLNGYDYQVDFNHYLNKIEESKISKTDFGLFLSKVIGKIGDRHSYIKGYSLPDKLYFPFTFAPFKDKILVITYNKPTKDYSLWDSDFPYLKSINNLSIEEILPNILPEEISAPKESYKLRALRELRDIESVFYKFGSKLPNPLPITLVNENGDEKKLNINLVSKSEKAYLWDERFGNRSFFWKEEDFNKPENMHQFFSIKNNIASIQIVDMLSKYNCPVFFEYLNTFMQKAKHSDALIIDVRNNGGGTRDLIQELAGYLINPDSVYVANVVRQKGKLPLNDDLIESLHNRYLFTKNEFDVKEQKKIDEFLSSFNPMYNLNNNRFSEFYYYLLNGKKLAKDKYHYTKPIYILANERTFSAASILVTVFKGLPNITIAGVNTDGSSGNSQRIKLPNSGLRGKISTMVSYQKDGKILDGIGTEPDLKIERNLEQILFKEDYQLNRLIEIIKTK